MLEGGLLRVAGQQEPFLARISADRVATLPNGDVEYLGNVVFRRMPDDPPLQVSSESAQGLPDGEMLWEGVRCDLIRR